MPLTLIVVGACASKRPKSPLSANRPLPQKIESCSELKRIITLRDQGFSSLKGRANIKSADHNLDIEIALVDPHYARIEILGPLGVRVGLLQLNPEWISLYIPRDKTLYRFPTSELQRDTLRRDQFLELLPVKVVPELFPGVLLERISVDRAASFDCRYDEAENVYQLRVVDDDKSQRGRWIWIDPTRFAPLKVFYFPRQLPTLGELHKKGKLFHPLVELSYENWTGEALATLASVIRIDHRLSKGADLTFEWFQTETWESPNLGAFYWKAPAQVTVKDY